MLLLWERNSSDLYHKGRCYVGNDLQNTIVQNDFNHIKYSICFRY